MTYPTGIYVDNNGNIFVADTYNHRIQKWTPGATQGITVAGGNGYGSAANQFNSPNGIYVDSNGNIFVADYYNNRIQKWFRGYTRGITVAGGNGYGSAANQFNSTNGVYVDSNGNIFVTDGNNNRIQKVQYQPQIIIPAGQTSGTASFNAINDLKFEDNEIIALETENIVNAIVSPTQPALNLTILDDDTTPNVLLSLSNSTLFEEKSAIQLNVSLSNSSGKNISVNLSFSGTAVLGTDYTVDKQNLNFVPEDSVETITISAINDNLVEVLESIQIQVSGGTNISTSYPSITAYLSSDDKPTANFSLDKASMSEAGGIATLTATLSTPTSRDVIITLKPSGTATYRGDYEASFVGKDEVINVAGGNGSGSAANQLNSPIGVYVDSNGNIFVADASNHRIQKWAAGATQGITMAGGNGFGLAANQLNGPTGVYVDSNGNIFVADASNHRIQKWTPGATQGITVAGENGYGSSGSAADQLSNPTGVYVDSNGNIFVADTWNHRIQKWALGATQGITVAGGNGQGSAGNQLSFPTGVYVDSNGNIFIADRYNNRIQKWAAGATQGITMAGGNGFGLAANQLNGPTGVYVDSNGNIFVVDAGNNRIQKWTPGATQGITVAGGNGQGSAANQLNGPTGVYVDSNGNIFVVDAGNNRIQKVQCQPRIIIPAGQISGVCTFKGIEDFEKELDETIVLSADSAFNTNLLTSSASIVLKDNQISFTKQLLNPIPSLKSAALSWGDYDQDGDQDLAILGYNDLEGAITRIYQNQNGTLIRTEQNLMQFLSGDIKWMDMNKDGYLDLIVSGMAVIDEDNSAPKTLLYLSNAGTSFSLVSNLTIEHLYSSKIALGDLDNDGDIDLAIMGRNINNQTVFQVYKKNDTQNTFTKITNFNPSIMGNDNDWDLKIADFDLDGDNDILYNGGYVQNNYVQSGGIFAFNLNYTGLRYEICKLFNDDSPLTIFGIGTQSNTPSIAINQSVNFIGGIPSLKDGDIAVGDYNNDGLNDILFTGRNAVNTPQALLYYQKSDKTFAKDPNISIDGLYNSTADWVDYDVDGDLDLIMTGLDVNSVQQTFFYKSNTGVKKNTAPSMPSNLQVTDKGNGFVEFKWDSSTDDYSSFFGYNIRLGTSPGGSELSNTMSNLQTGSRLLTAIPPLFINSYTTQLSPGRYYWSVQGIDQGFQGSPFATEQIFDLKYEWKLLNQRDIVDRNVSPMSNPKFALLDIDNDNDLDLVYGSSSDRKVYLYKDKEYQLVSKNIGYGGVENIVAGDVNNDGKIDLVINGTDKQLVIYLNTGGDFSEAYRLTNNGLIQTKLKIIDVNNNGLKEIMFAGMTSDLSSGVPKFYSLEWSGLSTFNFSDESSKIATLKNAAYDFGDFDKDSKIDFILSGSGNLGLRTILYRNTTLAGDPMSLSATVDVLPKITKGTIDCVDFDSDGDEDLIFTGSTNIGDIFQLYDNQLANNISSFAIRETNLDAIQESNLNFGDFNGDGYTDVFYSGMKTGTGKVTRLVQYNRLTKNYENSTFDYGNLTDAEVAFGDIDADGDLDMILGGNDVLNANNKILRVLLNVRNESAAVGKQAVKGNSLLADDHRIYPPVNTLSAFNVTNTLNANTAPNPPNINLVRSVTESDKKLLSFSWNAATDDNTPSTGLTYSLRIGTAADTDNLLSTNADKSGVLKVPSVGNVVGNLGWKIKMLPDGVYYWSVQSVDASFVGSTFSIPQQFTIRNGDLLTVPAQPEAFTQGNNRPCKATSEIYTVPEVNGATTYRWTYSGEGVTINGTGNSVSVLFSATFTTGTLSVEAMNVYGASPKRSIDINIGTVPAQPGAFTTSSPVVCQGYSKTYSISNVIDASDYVWSYSGTGVSISGSTASVSLTYGTSATSGILSVSAVGGCGNSAERTMNVTVIPQQKVINGAIANGSRHIHQASKSILLTPVMSTPITLSAGTVFIAEIVACPN